MKNQLSTFLLLIMFAMISCTETTTTTETTESTDKATTPDYETFENNVKVLRTFIKAHSSENIDALSELLDLHMQWSGPNRSDNTYGNKADYLAALKAYHDSYDDIQFTEGITLGDSTYSGFWSGSVFPENSATMSPDLIRIYGHWSANHVETGRDIHLKYYGVASVNEEGKIDLFSDYFDVASLMPVVEVEAE